MKHSESFTAVAEAIGNVHQGLDVLKRESKADAGKYSYKYTGFDHIWSTLKPLLAANKLSVIQSPTTGNGTQMGDFMSTTILHIPSGEWMEYDTRLIITRDDPQGYGSAVTYSERYIVKTIFKVVTSDDDNDAQTQRLADGEMKKEWVRAYTTIAKKADPEAVVTNSMFIKFMEEVYGKHPTRVLAKEHSAVLGTINAFNND